MRPTVASFMTSAFGTAGQRCLAGSLGVAVAEAYEPLIDGLVSSAKEIRVGDGMDEQVQMGPVISRTALERIEEYIERGQREGAQLLLDGRGQVGTGSEEGYYVGPTIFTDVEPEMDIAQDEIFGPVLGVIRVPDFDRAVEVINESPYGNAASLFTSSGKWAREFKYRVKAGNIGINIGIAAPIASFPFSGMKESFFGDLHGQGRDAILFFTERKVVITRWF
jgi:malonate-semialdehyde dehydrogenase (acetylating)/methylmalonate-semialdehyde dehydrogenase